MTTFETTVADKKARLGRRLTRPMRELASACACIWNLPDAVDRALAEGYRKLPHCRLIYALDIHATQISSNVASDTIESQWRGQNLAQRPFLEGSLPYQGFVLSGAYLSARTLEPCITAIQSVRLHEKLLGFIAADFPIRDLPDSRISHHRGTDWQQFRGDPAIRSTVFMQRRANSIMDERMEEVLAIMHALMREHGVFHGKLHFSGARFSVWHVDDPFNYRLHGADQIATAEVCMAYPRRPYPRRARVERALIWPVLEQMRALRNADDTVYLRSGSLNIINGMVGLNFSCDGSHYMSAQEFLAHDMSFWQGAALLHGPQGSQHD